MSFTKSVSLTFITRILLIILGLASGIIVARSLGPEGKGVFAVLAVISGVAVQFGNLGLHASNTYFISKKKEKLDKILGNSLWTGLFAGFLTASIIYFLVEFQILGGIDKTLLVLVLISVPFLLLNLFFQNVFLGLNKIFLFNFVQILNQVAILFGVIILFGFSYGNILNLIVLTTAVNIIVTLLILWYLFSRYKFHLGFDFIFFNESLKYGIKTYIASIFTFLILRADLYMVNLFRGSYETGLYSLAAGFGDMIYIIPATIGTLLFPRLSAENDNQKIVVMAKVSRYTVFIMAITCVLAAIISNPLIKLMYGESFSPAVLPFLILLPGIFLWSISSIFMNYFAGKGMPMIVIWSSFSGFIINVILNLLLISPYGMLGAAWSSTIAYSTMFFINLGYIIVTEKKSFFEFLLIKNNEVKNLIYLLIENGKKIITRIG